MIGKAMKFFLAVLILMALSSGTYASAQGWPQWRGKERDGKIEGFTAPAEWPAQLTRDWSVKVGAGDSTPALVGGRLYVFTRQGDDEVTTCLDADTGEVVWEDRYAAAALTGPAARHPGPRSSPAVAAGKVVTLGATGILSCLESETGNAIWHNDAYEGKVPRFYTGMSPLITDGLVIAHLGGPDRGVVIASDLNTGEKNWNWNGDAPAYASPVLLDADGTKMLAVQTADRLVGLGLTDGALLWQVDTAPARRFYNSATPLVQGQSIIYTGQGKGTRAIRIAKDGDGFTVKELWTNPEIGTAYNTPVINEGLLFGLSDRGNLFCLNVDNGQKAWADETRYQNFGSLLNAGSTIIALLSGGEMIAFEPTGRGYQQLARIKVADTAVYAHPILAGKRLYIKDADSLIRYTIE